MVGTGRRGGVGEVAGLGTLACFSGYFWGMGWEITCVCKGRYRWMGMTGRCYGGDDAVVWGEWVELGSCELIEFSWRGEYCLTGRWWIQ